MTMIDIIGWAAAAVFTSSYFFVRPRTLRIVQMLGALMWCIYGLLIPAGPVVVANLAVFGAAIWTTTRGRAAPAEMNEAMPSSESHG
jgi:uncharacterized membrane protein YjjB (DUF3815 family)